MFVKVRQKDNINSISVNVDKLGKNVSLNLYPAEVRENGVNILVITAGKYVNLEPMPRLKKKRVEELLEQMKAEIEAKSGRAWDEVKAFAGEKGLELV